MAKTELDPIEESQFVRYLGGPPRRAANSRWLCLGFDSGAAQSGDREE